jgi:hypothetical protein
MIHVPTAQGKSRQEQKTPVMYLTPESSPRIAAFLASLSRLTVPQIKYVRCAFKSPVGDYISLSASVTAVAKIYPRSENVQCRRP